MKNLYKSVLIVFTLIISVTSRSQVNDLNSYPSASAVILLDFDGHTVSGTNWNSGTTFTCNPSDMSDAAILEIFNRVAEDYRPFNINVTTSETKYNQAPVNRRIRVIITTTHEWYGVSAGGVAILNSFTWGNNTPCFVFSALQNYNIKNVAEACSHEAGHTFGLRHQSSYNSSCTKLSDYHWGVGTGEIGWAPIMGAAYNRNMTLWNNGPNSLGCNSIQSDLGMITSATNGIGYRTDDHSDAQATATQATFAVDSQFTISGVIERNDDKDLFKFTMPAFGRLQLNAIPYNVGTSSSGSDLDLQVEFLDGSFATIGTYNPGNLLSSIIDSFISAGTYYIRVDGKGNVYAPEYGSLGSYSLQATYTDETMLPLRRLELRGKLEGDIHSLSWFIDANEQIAKQEIQVSANGVNFITLDNPNNSLRAYSYRPLDNRPLLYRMHVTFDNQKEYYSNTIAIRPGKTGKPQLVGNIITGTAIAVSSPGIYRYQVIDQSGRLISKGAIDKGFSTVYTPNLTTGVYIIRFSDDYEQWSEKFIKR